MKDYLLIFVATIYDYSGDKNEKSNYPSFISG